MISDYYAKLGARGHRCLVGFSLASGEFPIGEGADTLVGPGLLPAIGLSLLAVPRLRETLAREQRESPTLHGHRRD